MPGLDLGPSAWPCSDPAFAHALSVHLGGPLSASVLQAFRAMLSFKGARGFREGEGREAAADSVVSWHGMPLLGGVVRLEGSSTGGDGFLRAGAREDAAVDGSQPERVGSASELGPPPLEWRHCMDDLGSSNKLCSLALERVVRSNPASAHLVWGGGGDQFLPFLL